MNLLDRIENGLSGLFSAVFRRGSAPDGGDAPDKEESTTRVYCRISDPEATAVREFLSLSEVPLVRLEVIRGIDQEAAFEFGVSQGVIGRSKSSMVELSDPNVSRMHARLEIDKTQTVIYDNNSTNGTKVNGRCITRQVLRNGDVISIGQTELRFSVIGPAKTAANRRSALSPGRSPKSQKKKGRR